METIWGKESLQVSASGTAEERITKRHSILSRVVCLSPWTRLRASVNLSAASIPHKGIFTKLSLGAGALQASCCLSLQILHSKEKLRALMQDQSEKRMLAQDWELQARFGVRLPFVPKGDLLEKLHVASTSLEKEIIAGGFLLPLRDNTTEKTWHM